MKGFKLFPFGHDATTESLLGGRSKLQRNNYSIFLIPYLSYIIEARTRIVIIMIVNDDIPIGIHTGAIQGRGIRKRTSIVAKLDGHLIKR